MNKRNRRDGIYNFLGLGTICFFVLTSLAFAQGSDILISGGGKQSQKLVSVEEYVQGTIEAVYQRIVSQVVPETVQKLQIQMVPPIYQQLLAEVYSQGPQHPVIRRAFQEAQEKGYEVAVEHYQYDEKSEAVRQLIDFVINKELVTMPVRHATAQITTELLKALLEQQHE